MFAFDNFLNDLTVSSTLTKRRMPVKVSATWKAGQNFCSFLARWTVICPHQTTRPYQNGNNVLQLLVFCRSAEPPGPHDNALPNVNGIQNPGSGVQRIHGRINSQLCNLAGQNHGAVQMGECGGRSRVGQVVCGHVNTLNRGDGPLSVEVMRSWSSPMSTANVG